MLSTKSQGFCFRSPWQHLASNRGRFSNSFKSPLLPLSYSVIVCYRNIFYEHRMDSLASNISQAKRRLGRFYNTPVTFTSILRWICNIAEPPRTIVFSTYNQPAGERFLFSPSLQHSKSQNCSRSQTS